jgi:DNA-binding NarL/FixJ family response regulator
MQPAIEANKQLVASLKRWLHWLMHLQKTDSQQAYAALQTTGKYYYTEAVNANKLLEASELSLEKIKAG